MGILDVFKKKKADEFDIPPDYSSNQPEFGQNQGFQQQQQPEFGQNNNQNQSDQFPPPFAAQGQQQQQFAQENYDNIPRGQSAGYPPQREMQSRESSNSLAEINMGKDFEIINAKLDAIKAELDSINQRVKRIERMSEPSGTKKEEWY